MILQNRPKFKNQTNLTNNNNINKKYKNNNNKSNKNDINNKK